MLFSRRYKLKGKKMYGGNDIKNGGTFYVGRIE